MISLIHGISDYRREEWGEHSERVLKGLNRLKRMVVPASHMEGGTMVIPGHGRLCEAADVALYQQMVTIVRDRIQDMIKKRNDARAGEGR